MIMARFLTYTSGLILEAIATGLRYGFQIMDATGLPSGTVYPALRSLERRGLVTAAWEDETAAHAAGRPARKNYRLTVEGETSLEALRGRFRGLSNALAARGDSP